MLEGHQCPVESHHSPQEGKGRPFREKNLGGRPWFALGPRQFVDEAAHLCARSRSRCLQVSGPSGSFAGCRVAKLRVVAASG
eukprot:7383321-Prymnesium_polylepis.1